MNLFSNAVESMKKTTRKRLTIKTFSQKKSGSICIKIKDTGSGIPKETLTKIFEPFFTTKKKGKGVGLGLSVVYGIIQEHGGTIEVESTLGEGTLFSITLFQEMDPKRIKSSLPNSIRL